MPDALTSAATAGHGAAASSAVAQASWRPWKEALLCLPLSLPPPTSLPLLCSLFRQISISGAQLLRLFLACLQGRAKAACCDFINEGGTHVGLCLCARPHTGMAEPGQGRAGVGLEAEGPSSGNWALGK